MAKDWSLHNSANVNSGELVRAEGNEAQTKAAFEGTAKKWNMQFFCIIKEKEDLFYVNMPPKRGDLLTIDVSYLAASDGNLPSVPTGQAGVFGDLGECAGRKKSLSLLHISKFYSNFAAEIENRPHQ